MKVNVKFISPLSLMVKKTDIKIEIKKSRLTLKELFTKIGQEYPNIHEKICTRDNKLNQGILCVIKNDILLAEEIDNKLIKNDDEIIFSIAIAGG